MVNNWEKICSESLCVRATVILACSHPGSGAPLGSATLGGRLLFGIPVERWSRVKGARSGDWRCGGKEKPWHSSKSPRKSQLELLLIAPLGTGLGVASRC